MIGWWNGRGNWPWTFPLHCCCAPFQSVGRHIRSTRYIHFLPTGTVPRQDQPNTLSIHWIIMSWKKGRVESRGAIFQRVPRREGIRIPIPAGPSKWNGSPLLELLSCAHLLVQRLHFSHSPLILFGGNPESGKQIWMRNEGRWIIQCANNCDECFNVRHLEIIETKSLLISNTVFSPQT